jgi:hypothetical protein
MIDGSLFKPALLNYNGGEHNASSTEPTKISDSCTYYCVILFLHNQKTNQLTCVVDSLHKPINFPDSENSEHYLN